MALLGLTEIPAGSRSPDEVQTETKCDECEWNGSRFTLCTDLRDHEDHPNYYEQYRYQSFHLEPSMSVNGLPYQLWLVALQRDEGAGPASTQKSPPTQAWRQTRGRRLQAHGWGVS